MKNCLSCPTKCKADPKVWDTNGGDFYHCTAVVPVQGFGVMWLENRNLNPDVKQPNQVGRLINLNIFREGHAHYKSGTAQNECPLWSGIMLKDHQIEAIEDLAQEELREEEFRRRVEERKEQLRRRAALPWYKRVFPFKIKIERI